MKNFYQNFSSFLCLECLYNFSPLSVKCNFIQNSSFSLVFRVCFPFVPTFFPLMQKTFLLVFFILCLTKALIRFFFLFFTSTRQLSLSHFKKNSQSGLIDHNKLSPLSHEQTWAGIDQSIRLQSITSQILPKFQNLFSEN